MPTLGTSGLHHSLFISTNSLLLCCSCFEGKNSQRHLLRTETRFWKFESILSRKGGTFTNYWPCCPVVCPVFQGMTSSVLSLCGLRTVLPGFGSLFQLCSPYLVSWSNPSWQLSITQLLNHSSPRWWDGEENWKKKAKVMD